MKKLINVNMTLSLLQCLLKENATKPRIPPQDAMPAAAGAQTLNSLVRKNIINLKMIEFYTQNKTKSSIKKIYFISKLIPKF